MLRISNKISVIVPCYKYAHYLEECVDSLVAQTLKPHEIIIVSDGSPDNTREVAIKIIEKYPDFNISFYDKENGGLSSVRNYGIDRATGDYIMCLDADDKMTPGALEEHWKMLEDDMDIAQCALMEFGMRHVVMTPPPVTRLERVMQANTVYCNILYPKKAWLEVGGYDESEAMRDGYEDWEFAIRILAAGYRILTSDFIALRYRVHDKQMTKATAHPHCQKLYKYIYDKHKELYMRKNLTVAGLKK